MTMSEASLTLKKFKRKKQIILQTNKIRKTKKKMRIKRPKQMRKESPSKTSSVTRKMMKMTDRPIRAYCSSRIRKRKPSNSLLCTSCPTPSS